MEVMNIVSNIVYGIIPLLFAITLHEVAHGWVANKLGDNTAKSLGRLTLNPLEHIDINGTIVFPLMIFILSSGAIMFGWAKPIPVKTEKLNKPKRDMIFVALAGPVANLLMAIGWSIILKISNTFSTDVVFVETLINISKIGIFINLGLMAFNLFPILPLDGGRILRGLLPIKWAIKFDTTEVYGLYIIIGLVILGITSYYTSPIINGATQLITYIL